MLGRRRSVELAPAGRRDTGKVGGSGIADWSQRRQGETRAERTATINVFAHEQKLKKTKKEREEKKEKIEKQRKIMEIGQEIKKKRRNKRQLHDTDNSIGIDCLLRNIPEKKKKLNN